MEKELLQKPTDLFNYINTLLTIFNGMCPLRVNNKVVSDTENLCEEFGKYFQSVYQLNIISRNNLNTNEDCTTDNIGIPVITEGETLRLCIT